MGIIIKSMDNKYSVMQYAVARNFFGLFPLFIYLFFSYEVRTKNNTFNLNHKLISMGRGLSIVFAQGCFYLSIMNLEYATAATLVFATPIFLTALSVPLLGNLVGPWRWFAVLLGFLGIVIIVKPGYCGSGTVWSRWFGKKAAEIILNFEQKSAFYNIPFRKIPFSGEMVSFSAKIKSRELFLA